MYPESCVSWSCMAFEQLNVVDILISIHNIAPSPQLCGRHTGGVSSPFMSGIWQHELPPCRYVIVGFKVTGFPKKQQGDPDILLMTSPPIDISVFYCGITVVSLPPKL